MVMLFHLCLAKSPNSLNPGGPDLVISGDERQIQMQCGSGNDAIRFCHNQRRFGGGGQHLLPLNFFAC